VNTESLDICDSPMSRVRRLITVVQISDIYSVRTNAYEVDMIRLGEVRRGGAEVLINEGGYPLYSHSLSLRLDLPSFSCIALQ
jgi:hypothetical protein